jgi:hypothetical protein
VFLHIESYAYSFIIHRNLKATSSKDRSKADVYVNIFVEFFKTILGIELKASCFLYKGFTT